MVLYDYQIPAADALLAALLKHRVALDTSDLGTGKSYVAADVARRLGCPVLVVCPKAVVPPWRRILADAGVTATVLNYEKLRTGNTPFLSRDKGAFDWRIPEDTLIIWDEAHKAKSPDSQISKMVRSAKKFRNLLLSATLAESPVEMRVVGYLTGLHKWTDWWQWCRKNGCKSNPWGGIFLATKARVRVLTELHATLFPDFGTRVRIADLGDRFPETQISAEAYEFEGNIQAVFDELERALADLAKTAAADININALTLQLRARQEVELRKVPGLIRMAEDAIAEGMSVVIFTNYTATLELLCEKLKCRGVAGGQTEAEREAVVREFQADRARCVVVNIQAGGVGLSLHDVTGKHPRLALVCPTYGAKDLRQALGRVRRAGGLSRSIQRIVFAANTIEETICETLRAKLDNLDLLNDGDLSLNGLVAPVSEPINNMEPTLTATPTTATPAASPVEFSILSKSPSAEAPRAHSRHSPSSLKYKLTCSGWQNDSDPDRDTTAADRGTRGHAAWEAGSSASLMDDPSLAKAVDDCIKYSDRFIGQIFLEMRVAVLDQFGHFDRLVLNGKDGFLLDAKFAHNLYKADAPQFWAYCVGIWNDPRWEHLETIEVHVLHPWLGLINVHKFVRAVDYERLMLAVGALIARARIADPSTFVPFLGCQYCGRAGTCIALASLAMKVAVGYSETPLILPEGPMHGSDITDPGVLAQLMRIGPIIEKAASGWRKAALALWQENGVAIPGFDLIEREGARKITSARIAYDLFLERGGEAAAFADIADVGIKDMEDLWASIAPKGKKGASKQELTDLLTDREALTLGQKTVYLKQQKQHQ